MLSLVWPSAIKSARHALSHFLIEKNEHENVKILTTDLWLYAFGKAASVSVEEEKVLVNRQRLQQPLDSCLCCSLLLRFQKEGESEEAEEGWMEGERVSVCVCVRVREQRQWIARCVLCAHKIVGHKVLAHKIVCTHARIMNVRSLSLSHCLCLCHSVYTPRSIH
jgi:hypothetical protein